MEGSYEPLIVGCLPLIWPNSDGTFDVLEDAKRQLARVCSVFEASDHPSSLVKMRVSRKPAKAKANEIMQGMAAHGFDQLRDYVNSLEATLKRKQGKVSSVQQAKRRRHTILIVPPVWTVCTTIPRRLQDAR